MADNLTKQQRQHCMKQVKSQNTKPELIVRKLIHSMGYRYRLYKKDLPGCPDLVFASRKKLIFVNGCYWHRHHCKSGQSMPVARKNYWQTKFDQNVKRDKESLRKLKNLGWNILVIWECQIAKGNLAEKIVNFLE